MEGLVDGDAGTLRAVRPISPGEASCSLREKSLRLSSHVSVIFCYDSAGGRKSLSPTWMMQGYSWTFPLGKRSFSETSVGFIVSMFISIATYTVYW